MSGTIPIAMQLWSGRFAPTIERRYEELAEMGYDAVEPYTALVVDDPASYRQTLDAAGLRCPSVHFELHHLQEDHDRWFDLADTLGAKIIVVPHLRKTDRLESADDWRRLGEDLQDIAGRGADRGFVIAWGNHGIEYARLPDGSRPIEHLLAAPGVSYELVLGWLQRAGEDPASELERYGARIHSLRVSDNGPAGKVEDGGWADIGDGLVGYEGLWPQIAALPQLRVIVVDHPGPDDYLRFARRSIAAIRQGLAATPIARRS